MRVLVVGGAGYVGSHAVRECLRCGVEPVVFDNYLTGSPDAVAEVERISGDLLDPKSVRSALKSRRFDAVFHFGGLSFATESVRLPAQYYRNNIAGTLNLLHTMLDCGVERLVYSSTAAVYGDPHEIPIQEDHSLAPLHPYGRSAAIVEEILADTAARQELRYASIRYFNAAGADPSGEIGEDPQAGTRLIPQIFRTALEQQPSLRIFGTDYDTPDGTCIRDFVHVNDIAQGHVLALENIDREPNQIFNLGSNEGYSVREIVEEAQMLIDRPLAVVEARRRPGDPAVLVASDEKARERLGWEPRHSDLTTILETAWQWHSRHPNGYKRPEQKPRPGTGSELFGDIAVRLGFVNESDVDRALERQGQERDQGNPHKLIGMHMLEMGILSTSQLIDILKYYEER
ncbi:MAG: UDP-glucose 4-epimerase GalE [Planctomycetota bacterium]